jgi:hypothetical protein
VKLKKTVLKQIFVNFKEEVIFSLNKLLSDVPIKTEDQEIWMTSQASLITKDFLP